MKVFTLPYLPVLSFLAATLLAASSARGATWTWDPLQSPSGGTDSTSATNSTWAEPGSVNNWYNGSTAVTYGGTTSDTVVFGSASTPTSATFNVLVSGTVNAGVVDFNNYVSSSTVASAKASSYFLKAIPGTYGTIVGPTGGTLVIQSAGAAYGNDTIQQINFTGATNYEITGSSVTNIGNGVTLGAVATDGNVTFAGNLTLGTGSDFGEVSVSRQNGGTVGANSTDTLTVSNGWQLNLAGANTAWTQTTYLNGMGQTQGQTGTISIAGGTAVNETVSGNVILQSDASIIGTPSTTKYPTQVEVLSGNISGSANLYLGYNSTGTGTPGTDTQKFVIGGTNAAGGPTASTNSGATIVFNSTSGDSASGGVSYLGVQLGQNNGLSTATSLILGETGSYNETNGIAAPNSKTSGVSWKTSDGAFDLAGYSQTLQGIMVGGVTQKNGNTDVLLQGNNVIYNNSGAGTSVLNIVGTTGNAVTGGFGGIIEDYATTSGGKVAVSVGTGGVLMLSGANTYSGGTTVDGGLLEVGTSSSSTTTENNSVVGTLGATTGSLVINSGGTLDLEGHPETVGVTTLGSGGATIQSPAGSATLTSTNGVTVNGTGNSIAANVTVLGGSTGINIGSGAGLSLAGTIDNANVSGTLSGAGGTGMVTGTLNLQSGGVLNSGTINPSTGKPYGPLAVSTINFTGPSELAFALSTTPNSGTGVDTTSVINVGTLMGGSNVITVLVTGGSGSLGAGQSIVLLTYNANTSSVSFSLNDQSSDLGTLDWDALDKELLLVGNAAVPEPPAWLLLLGGVGQLALWRLGVRSRWSGKLSP